MPSASPKMAPARQGQQGSTGQGKPGDGDVGGQERQAGQPWAGLVEFHGGAALGLQELQAQVTLQIELEKQRHQNEHCGH